MDFDKLQKTWQEQPIPGSITIKEESLLKLTRRDQQNFLAAILRRDVLEVTLCILLVVFFLKNYVASKSISSLIIGLGCLFVGCFFVIDRIIQKKRQPLYEDTLICCLKQSLVQINHQIWLLRNVLWWYILPIFIGMFIGPILETGIRAFTTSYVIIAILLALGIYRLNQRAVCQGLIPYRNEILTLLHQLDSNGGGHLEIELPPPDTKIRKFMDCCFGFLVLIIAIVGIGVIAGNLLVQWTNHQDLDIDDFSNQTQYVTPLLFDPNLPRKPFIIEARYGTRRKWIDVTQIITKKVDSNTHPILATNDLAGDPHPGQVKRLVVHYIYRGKQRTTQVQEIQPLQLPTSEDNP